jgi:hypothetical protein
MRVHLRHSSQFFFSGFHFNLTFLVVIPWTSSYSPLLIASAILAKDHIVGFPRNVQVMRIFDAWQRAAVPRAVVAAFRAAGFVPIERDGDRYRQVDLLKTTQFRDWAEEPHTEAVVSVASLRRVRLVENHE